MAPDDPAGTVYEFFSPFAHVPGKYEWCRIRSPTHGVFDVFILFGPTTQDPADVYVNDDAGQRFMMDRYPQSRAHRIPEKGLRIHESDDGRTVTGSLRAGVGPLRRAEMRLEAAPGATPRNVPYGGEDVPVWGNPALACWGVDLSLEATADGRVEFGEGRVHELRGEPAIVTLGSFGRLSPRTAAPQPQASRPRTR